MNLNVCNPYGPSLMLEISCELVDYLTHTKIKTEFIE